MPILLACGIPGDKPGTYSITFSVSNSAGVTATVIRQVVIRAVCPVGEQLCPDKVGMKSQNPTPLRQLSLVKAYIVQESQVM